MTNKIELRNRKAPLKVYVSSSEREDILARAKSANLTVSDYLRTLGLGHSPKNIFDQDAILALIKLHADQGRLGGLLKLWLTKSADNRVTPEIKQLLQDLIHLQQQLKMIITDDL